MTTISSSSAAVRAACARRACPQRSASGSRSPRSTATAAPASSAAACPKKLFVYASQFPEHFDDAAGYGWTVPEASFDWPTLIANKDREIGRLSGLYQSGVEKSGGEAFHSRATLVDAHTVRIENEDRTVTAEHILIATGGRPNPHAALPGHEHCIFSNEAFDLPDPAQVDRDCRRRLHRRRVRQHLPWPRRRHDADLSRQGDSAALRHGPAPSPARGDGGQGHPHPLPHHLRADREA